MRFVMLTILVLFMNLQSVNAGVVTPSDVYQRTEVFKRILKEHGILDEHKMAQNDLDTTLRHPRHVIQKVRECHMMLAKLLLQKELPTMPLPDLTKRREIRPADVSNAVEYLITEAKILVGKDRERTVPLVAGKIPSDVYANLEKTCDAINVHIVPSDIYQVMLAVNENLDQIMQVRGYDDKILYEDFGERLPIHVYNKTWMFLKELRELALLPDFAIPGGVIIPQDIVERLNTNSVLMSVMNDALADTSAMQYTLGIIDISPFPEFVDGKTEADLFSQIERAYRVVQYLLEQERMLEEVQ